MKASQADMLLRIAEDTWADNDATLAETRRLMAAGARRILDDEALLIKAWELNQQDKQRFMSYMPQEHRQVGQHATGRAEQRTALAPVKKVAENG
jgi:hypothetical protein